MNENNNGFDNWWEPSSNSNQNSVNNNIQNNIEINNKEDNIIQPNLSQQNTIEQSNTNHVNMTTQQQANNVRQNEQSMNSSSKKNKSVLPVTIILIIFGVIVFFIAKTFLATQITYNSINQAKINSYKDSAYGFIDAAEKYITIAEMGNDVSGTYDINKLPSKTDTSCTMGSSSCNGFVDVVILTLIGSKPTEVNLVMNDRKVSAGSTITFDKYTFILQDDNRLSLKK